MLRNINEKILKYPNHSISKNIRLTANWVLQDCTIFFLAIHQIRDPSLYLVHKKFMLNLKKNTFSNIFNSSKLYFYFECFKMLANANKLKIE